MNLSLTIKKNRFNVLIFLLFLESINYLLTTSQYNQFTTTIDVGLAISLLVYYLMIGHMGISINCFGIIGLLLLKIIFAKDIPECFLRASSLIIQILFFFEIPKSVISDNCEDSIAFANKTIKLFTKFLLFIGGFNAIIMLYCKKMGMFSLWGIEVGNYISGRYNGFFNTQAFCGEIAVIVLLLSFIYKDSDKKKIRFLGICISIITILCCRTRAAIVSVMAFFTVLLINRSHGIKRKLLRNFVIVIVLLGFIGVVVLLGSSVLESFSSNRWSLWINTIETIFSEFKILGINDLNTSIYYANDVFDGGAHNAFIQLFYNTGLVIASVFIIYVAKNIKVVRTLLDIEELPFYGVSLYAGIFSILAFGLFESHLFFLRGLLSYFLWYFLLIGSLKYYETDGE